MDKVSQEELFEEVLMMLMAALSIAGAKDDCMKEALDAYEERVEAADDDKTYSYKDIVEIILSLKKDRKDLFL